MDHLPYPQHPAVERQRVPYVCRKPYDRSPFRTYPLRAGWPQVLPAPDRPTFSKYDQAHPVCNEALEDFLQTWLVFGLLHEVLQESYTEQDYVRTLEDEREVHTTELIKHLETWRKGVADQRDGEKIALYTHIRDCLRLVESTAIVLIHENRRDFNRGIRQSIAALGESIATTADTALQPASGSDMPMSWRTIYLNSSFDFVYNHRMLQNRWCRYDVSSATNSFLTLSAVHFLGALGSPPLQRDHASCAEKECKHLQIDLAKYVPTHLPDCNCSLCGLEDDDLAPSLRNGTFPLLRISGDSVQALTVEAIPFKNTPYVALSHVWADGLGNQRATKLHRCQLLRVSQLLQRLRGMYPWRGSQPESRDLLLWCDSLCVPSPRAPNPTVEHTELRDIAMQRMRMVYENAAYVLILDKTLEPYALSDIGMLEAAVRFVVSPYMRRLWTFQEVVLAKVPLVQFADIVVDVRALWEVMAKLRDEDLASYGIAIDMITWIRLLRLPYHAAADSAGPDLANLALSLRQRRVSEPADEALCIATLLNLDVSHITLASEGRRMEALWELLPGALRGIPKTVIYNQLKRLDSRGFHWAPASMLQSFDVLRQIEITNKDDKALQARQTPDGLVVRFPAWAIVGGSPPPGLPLDLWPGSQLCPNNLHLRLVDGTWYAVDRPPQGLANGTRTLWDTIADASDKLVLITEAITPSGSERFVHLRSGLLASTSGVAEQGELVKSLAVVRINKLPEAEQMMWTAAYEEALVLQQNATIARALHESAGSDDFRHKYSRAEQALRRHISRQLEEDTKLASLARHAAVSDGGMLIAGITAILFID